MLDVVERKLCSTHGGGGVHGSIGVGGGVGGRPGVGEVRRCVMVDRVVESHTAVLAGLVFNVHSHEGYLGSDSRDRAAGGTTEEAELRQVGFGYNSR